MDKLMGGETELQHEMRTRTFTLWSEREVALEALKPRYTMDMAHHYYAAVDQCKEAYSHLLDVLRDEIGQKHGLPPIEWKKP